MVDYYQILGVPRNAPQSLIKKTYAALQKIYHPDVYVGDSAFATEKIKEINEAYKILSDKRKREAHDRDLNSRNNNHDDFYEEDTWDEKAEETYSSMKESEWDYICSFYPEADQYFKELKILSGALAFQFQMILVENKAFKDAFKISSNLEKEFLKSKFGTNSKIQSLAKDAILNNFRDFAKDLNKALNILGQNSFDKVLSKLSKDHEKFASEFYPRYDFDNLIKETPKKSKQAYENKTKENKKYNAEPASDEEPFPFIYLAVMLLMLLFIIAFFLGPPEIDGDAKYRLPSLNQTNHELTSLNDLSKAPDFLAHAGYRKNS